MKIAIAHSRATTSRGRPIRSPVCALKLSYASLRGELQWQYSHGVRTSTASASHPASVGHSRQQMVAKSRMPVHAVLVPQGLSVYPLWPERSLSGNRIRSLFRGTGPETITGEPLLVGQQRIKGRVWRADTCRKQRICTPRSAKPPKSRERRVEWMARCERSRRST